MMATLKRIMMFDAWKHRLKVGRTVDNWVGAARLDSWICSMGSGGEGRGACNLNRHTTTHFQLFFC
jgi:hypothetical protein